MLIDKTLIIRLSSIGDIILASPLIRVLHRKFPDAQIDFAVKMEFAELLECHPFINTLYRIDTKLGFAGLKTIKEKMKTVGYDLVIDIHNNFRSMYLRSGLGARVVTVDKRQFERFLLTKFKINRYNGIIPVAERYIETVKEFGVENDGEGLEVFVPPEIIEKVSERLKSLRFKSSPDENRVLTAREKLIGFCPGAKHSTKMWLKENFVQLGNLLKEKYNARVILFGGSEDVTLCSEIFRGITTKVINLAGELPLLEIAAVMDLCDVVVTNDTGLMHLAAARKRKVVAIFGPTVQEFGFFPYGTENVVIERRGLECRPCTHIGSAKCPKGHFKCMREIRVEEVMAGAERMLNRQRTTADL